MTSKFYTFAISFLFLPIGVLGADCKSAAFDLLEKQFLSPGNNISKIHYFAEIGVDTSQFLTESEQRNLLDNGWSFVMIATTANDDGVSYKRLQSVTLYPYFGEDGSLVCDKKFFSMKD